jgi:hypothetical protein
MESHVAREQTSPPFTIGLDLNRVLRESLIRAFPLSSLC